MVDEGVYEIKFSMFGLHLLDVQHDQISKM